MLTTIKKLADIDASAGINEYSLLAMQTKLLMHTQGKKFLKELAEKLGLEPADYSIRSNKGGAAVSGEVTLHADKIYVQISEFYGKAGVSVLYRACVSKTDYSGKQNHFTTAHMLNEMQALDTFVFQCKRLMESF